MGGLLSSYYLYCLLSLFAGFMADDNASLTQYLDNVSNNAVSFYAENF